ncbi:hypothetical protein [uncultured Prevotella sp.]|uniref:hypothetical protein n=1 Tax=uncultured Prevotella sp. TaxID=159272 RepID=UPI0028062D23|nr:hypothetical protein [uncultured Prevotella sp.]
MFKITKSFNRLALVIILAISGTISALAENKIMLGDGGTISIKPGETKEIDVNLINDVELYTAQFDMELTSSKIKIVEGSFKINEERVDRESFLAPSLVRQPDGKMRLCLLTRDLSTPIAGTEGSLGTIKIQADPTFTSNDNAKIYFSKCCGSDKNAKLTYFDAPKYQAVSPMVGTLATAENAFSIKPGEKHKVDIVMKNEIYFCGIQTDITLPAGLQIEKKENGKYKFEYSSRLSDNFSIMSSDKGNGKVRIMLSSLPVDRIQPYAEGTDGVIFSFNVVADENFVTDETSAITFSNTLAANDAGVEYALDITDSKVVVTSLKMGNDAAYAKLTEEVAALQKSLDDAKAKVAEECKDVAENFTEAVAAIQAQIDAIKTDLDTKNAACDLTEESTLDAEAVKAVNDAIAKYLEDAAAAQADFQKKVANDAAYAKLIEEVAALQKSLDDAKAKVAEECKDVAENFTEAVAAIQTQIDAIKKDLDDKNTAIELTEESTLDAEAVKAVNDAIAKYLEDAATAQANFEKKAANDAAYAKLTEEIAAVQARFDEVVKTIEKDYAMVAAQFAETEAGIQNDIDAVAEELKAKADRIELDENSTVDLQAIKTAIEKLLTDAKDAYQKKIDANETAYKRLTDEIAAIQTRFDEVKKIIDTECNLVAAQFAGIEANIQYDINKKKDELKNMYENIELDENSTLDLQTIKDAIEQLLVDAKAAQETAGIYSISALTRDGVSVYTLEGNKVDTPVKGNVYIVRYADGTIKKVFVR